MRILSIRPEPPGRGGTVARFDVETPWGLRLFNMKLSHSPRGYRAFAPSAFGSPAVTFTPDAAAKIVSAALSALGDIDHGATRAA